MKIEITALRVAYATISNDLTRPYLCGIWIHRDRINASNGFSAVECINSVGYGPEDPTFIKLEKAPPANKRIQHAFLSDWDIHYTDAHDVDVAVGRYDGIDERPIDWDAIFSGQTEPHSVQQEIVLNFDQIAKWQRAARLDHMRMHMTRRTRIPENTVWITITPNITGVVMPAVNENGYREKV